MDTMPGFGGRQCDACGCAGHARNADLKLPSATLAAVAMTRMTIGGQTILSHASLRNRQSLTEHRDHIRRYLHQPRHIQTRHDYRALGNVTHNQWVIRCHNDCGATAMDAVPAKRRTGGIAPALRVIRARYHVPTS